MKKASITETKNNLSRLIEEVKNGTTIIIFDRNRPVARIEPVTAAEGTDSDRIAHLVRQGLVASAKRPLDLQAFLAREKHALPEGASAVQILESEREQGR
jgi:prevent-host-death family protein